ncbi:chromosomal passenger protein [Novymonas esmeraldas]|uniref:Chromosomal passenger protein n=1 Tax=Novymonas esmeraldas TaxID=1808958 RepID=A0AAW0EZJ4_9TRYP
MSGYRTDIDPFKDIRVLPREAAQLRHHLSRINHTLQTRYFVAAEVSELALQPDKSDEFLALYKDEVQRVVAKLNRNAKRQYAVVVDPLRLTTGFEIKLATNTSRAASPHVEAKWTASLVETSRHLAEQQAVDANRAALAATLQSTPSSQQTQTAKGGGVITAGGVDHGADGGGGASTGVVDSDVRKAKKESFLFSTPPAFAGFINTGASPEERPSPA